MCITFNVFTAKKKKRFSKFKIILNTKSRENQEVAFEEIRHRYISIFQCQTFMINSKTVAHLKCATVLIFMQWNLELNAQNLNLLYEIRKESKLESYSSSISIWDRRDIYIFRPIICIAVSTDHLYELFSIAVLPPRWVKSTVFITNGELSTISKSARRTMMQLESVGVTVTVFSS